MSSTYRTLCLTLVCLTLGVMACSDNQTLSDPSGDVPQITQFSVSPDSVFFDRLPRDPQGRAEIKFRVRLIYQLGSTVTSAFAPTGSAALASFVILNGANEEVSADLAGDTLTLRLTQQQLNDLTLFATLTTPTNQTASARASLNIIRPNSRPVLDSVSSPDTVRIPAQGSFVYQIRAFARDSNGVADIRFVEGRVDSTNAVFNLLDDGDINGLSGDQLRGDGIFTITVAESSSGLARRRTTRYQAVDRAGIRSDSIRKTITYIR
jgi:hypothetical protein